MDTPVKYPVYLKAPERGLYYKVTGPFAFQSLRYVNTPSGISAGIITTETSQGETSWLLDSGLRSCTVQEYVSIAKRIKEHVNDTL